ncbi:MAG: hypothetical protein ACC662_01515, partial [Planctomycetota bacterium]
PSAAARAGDPGSASETLAVSVRAKIRWKDVGKAGNVNIWEHGEATLDLQGTARLEKQDGESLDYAVEGLRVSWYWQQTWTVSPHMDGEHTCPAGSVLSVEHSEGSRALGAESSLRVFLGETARMAAAPFGGGEDVEALYMLHGLVGVDTTIEKRQTDCFPAPYPGENAGKVLFMLVLQATATSTGRLRRHYRWKMQENVARGSTVALQILDLGPKPALAGETPDGDIDVDVSVRIGKPAVLQIHRSVGGNSEDVTWYEGDPPIDVFAGERVRLEAVGLPGKGSVSDITWTVPGPVVQDFVVEGGKSGFETGRVDPLDEGECRAPKIDFVWWKAVDGAVVKLEGEVDGKRRTAEARFHVRVPEIDVRTVVPAGATWQVADIAEDEQALICVLEGEHTITFRHPPLPPDTPGETQYVQLVETRARNTKHRDALAGPCMEQHAKGLDTSYPYGPGPRTTDNPYADVTYLDLTLSVDHDYRMFLMYRPKCAEAIFVPLRVVRWFWHGRAERKRIVDPWDTSKSSISKEPKDAPAEGFPEWKQVCTANMPWAPCAKK